MRRLLVLFFAFFCGLIGINAQMVTHVVKKGETVKSIAKKYGVDISDIIHENMDARNGIRVGMILYIPASNLSVIGTDQKKNKNVKVAKQKRSKKTKVNTLSPTQTYGNALVASPQKEKKSLKPKITAKKKLEQEMGKRDISGNISSKRISSFSSLGLTFGNYFGDDIVGMTYGLQGQYFLPNRIGVTLGVGTNYGVLEGESDADIDIRIGPSYVYPLTNNLYVMGTACYTLTLAKRNGASGSVSGANIIPTLGYSFGKIMVAANGILRWRSGGSIGIGAYISVAYSF